MNRKEFKKLKHGDKVYIAYTENILEVNIDGKRILEEVLSDQEKNGGYFIVSIGPQPHHYVDQLFVDVGRWKLFENDIELYPPSWSYEKDY
jgi:hypothetical protein